VGFPTDKNPLGMYDPGQGFKKKKGSGEATAHEMGERDRCVPWGGFALKG